MFSVLQIVAVKQLDKNAMQGNREFLEEVAALSHVQHPNLVNLIGYCTDGQQRILVYEYLSNGSLEDHLFGKFPTFSRLRVHLSDISIVIKSGFFLPVI